MGSRKKGGAFPTSFALTASFEQGVREHGNGLANAGAGLWMGSAPSRCLGRGGRASIGTTIAVYAGLELHARAYSTTAICSSRANIMLPISLGSRFSFSPADFSVLVFFWSTQMLPALD